MKPTMLTQKSCLPFLLGFVLAGFPLCVYIIHEVEYTREFVSITNESRESKDMSQQNSLQKVRLMKIDSEENVRIANKDAVSKDRTKEMNQQVSIQKIPVSKSDNDEKNLTTTSKEIVASGGKINLLQSSNAEIHSDEKTKISSAEKIEVENKLGSYFRQSAKSGWVPASVMEYHLEQCRCTGGASTQGEKELAEIRKQVQKNIDFPNVRSKIESSYSKLPCL